jgi:hypothetical protein
LIAYDAGGASRDDVQSDIFSADRLGGRHVRVRNQDGHRDREQSSLSAASRSMPPPAIRL